MLLLRGSMVQTCVAVKVVILVVTLSPTQSQSWLCEKGGMHIALAYDCRGNVEQQHSFFTQFLSKFPPTVAWIKHNDRYKAPSVRIRLTLMIYGPRELLTAVTLTQANYTWDGFNDAFKVVLNNSGVSCPQAVPIQKALGKITGELKEAKEEAALKMRKLAMFVLWEDASSNTSRRLTAPWLDSELRQVSDIRSLYIVVTGVTNFTSTNKYIIYTRDLNSTKGLVGDSLYALCNYCGSSSEGYYFSHDSCYLIVEERLNLTAGEADKACGDRMPGSRVISINTDLENNFAMLELRDAHKKNKYKYLGPPSRNETLKNYDERIKTISYFNVFIGLSRKNTTDGEKYLWNDGGPFVLVPEWTTEQNSSCFYISFKSVTANGIIETPWKGAECDERIENTKLFCEKKMNLNQNLQVRELSFKSLPKQGRSSLLNAHFFRLLALRIIKNLTDVFTSSAMIKVLPDVHLTSCQLRKDDDNIEQGFFCQKIRDKEISSSRSASTIHQIYISEVPGSSDYFQYDLKARRNTKLSNESILTGSRPKVKDIPQVQNCDTTATSDWKVKAISENEWRQKIDDRQTCLYDVDVKRNILGLKNNSHLQKCVNTLCKKNCPYCVKCPHAYCIPVYLVHDGVEDCPEGEDENTLSEDAVVCQGIFKFTLNELCVQCKLYLDVFQSDVNDFKYECKRQCDSGLVCVSSVVRNDSSNDPTSSVTVVEANIKIYRSADSYILTPQLYTLIPFFELVEVNVAGCGMDDYSKMLDGIKVSEIISLDMSRNNIGRTSGLSRIDQMVNLKRLNVSHNKNLKFIQHTNFPSQIEIVDISNTLISDEVLESLLLLSELKVLEVRNVKPIDLSRKEEKRLDILDMRGTELTDLKTGYLSWLSIQTALYTDDYRVCCEIIRGPSIPEEKCHAPRDAISTCRDLIGDPVKRAILWLVGVLSLLGNMAVVSYRLFWDRAVFRTAYGLFVVCLGVSDFIMGVYLMIIAGADLMYRNLYVLNDTYWRHGNVCKLAGVLSTFSSESSTIFICLVTLDRFLVIRYPFGQHRFTKTGKISSLCLTLIVCVVVSVIPALFPGWEIYSSNGMCLALPFSAGRHKGWEYSAALFVGLNFVLFILIAIGQLAIFQAITSYKEAAFSITRDGSRKSQDFAVAKQLFLVALSDFCCWFPIGIMGIMSLRGYRFDLDVYAWSAVLVLPVNSAINPIIYTLPAVYKRFKSRNVGSVLTFQTFLKHLG